MKAYFENAGHTVIRIELTRRNLLSLLAKLDGSPPDSKCTIGINAENGPGSVWVTAVEDGAHYTERQAGAMHPVTEAVL